MDFIVTGVTDIGTERDTNQDSYCYYAAKTPYGKVAFAIVCDGMGGLKKGEVASASIVSRFAEWFEHCMASEILEDTAKTIREIRLAWKRLILTANVDIMTYGDERRFKLGSTATAMIILWDGSYLIVHVGDTRVYQIDSLQARVLTEDQTYIAREIKKGNMTLEQARNNALKNALLQCVGAGVAVKPEFYTGKAEKNVCYLLCSDGFRHAISVGELHRACVPARNKDVCDVTQHLQHLVETVKARGERDNITAVTLITN